MNRETIAKTEVCFPIEKLTRFKGMKPGTVTAKELWLRRLD